MEDLSLELDSPELDSTVDDVEDGAEQIEETAEGDPASGQPENQEEKPDSPYTTRYSREMRAALKNWETASPENAKFAKQARDNHARLFALNQIEPKGIDGIREKYALLDAVGGAEKFTEMQQRMQDYAQSDEMLINGDPKVLEAFGNEFDGGFAKLAPAILDRVSKVDPEAYNAAIMPHVVRNLENSDLLKSFNSLVDVLNTTDDPRLDQDAKFKYVISSLTKMSNWFNSIQSAPTAAPSNQGTVDTRVSDLDRREQEFHWKTNIQPNLVAYENKKFEELFAPYQKRLKLSDDAKNDLMSSFKQGLSKAGKADTQYAAQMGLYQKQKNPDAAAVTNYVKNAINKHSDTVLKGLINSRYGSFLNGKPKTQAPTQANPNGKPVAKGPVAPNVEIRTVKPAFHEIDHRQTTPQMIYQKMYKLTNGKTVQVRKP